MGPPIDSTRHPMYAPPRHSCSQDRIDAASCLKPTACSPLYGASQSMDAPPILFAMCDRVTTSLSPAIPRLSQSGISHTMQSIQGVPQPVADSHTRFVSYNDSER